MTASPRGKTLRQLAERAAAVVYLKIAGRDHDLPAARGYFRQSAQVLEVLKWPVTASDAAAKAFHNLALHDPKAPANIYLRKCGKWPTSNKRSASPYRFNLRFAGAAGWPQLPACAAAPARGRSFFISVTDVFAFGSHPCWQ